MEGFSDSEARVWIGRKGCKNGGIRPPGLDCSKRTERRKKNTEGRERGTVEWMGARGK